MLQEWGSYWGRVSIEWKSNMYLLILSRSYILCLFIQSEWSRPNKHEYTVSNPNALISSPILIAWVSFTPTRYLFPICKIGTVRINDLFNLLVHFKRFWFYSVSPHFYLWDHYCLNCYRDDQPYSGYYIEKTVDSDVLWVSQLYHKTTKKKGIFCKSCQWSVSTRKNF